MQCRFNHIKITVWLCVLLAAPAVLLAGDVKLIRTIEKAFLTNTRQLVEVRNQYGNVHISSGSGSRIMLKVTIEARGRTVDIAQQLIDEVYINTRDTRDYLRVATETPRHPGIKLGDKGLAVRYELEIPRGNPLKIVNKFGNIALGDRRGNVDVQIKNGHLTGGRLEGSQNTLEGYFSHADIGLMRTGQIDFQFGNVTISEAGYVKVDIGGGNLNVGIAKTLEMYVKQGKVSIGRADVVRGEYSSKFFALGYLGKKLDMEVKYAETFTIGEVGPDFSSIKIEQSYSPVKLNFNPEAQFQLEANLKKGKLHYDAPTVSMMIMEDHSEDCDCVEMTYMGRFGSNSRDGGEVEIEGYYGTIKITQ